jgi:outer membrane protein TolC
MKYFAQILLFMAMVASPFGMTGAQTMTDTVRLSYEDYLGIVLENHPVAKQAEIRGLSGRQYLRTARGAFDPYLSANWDSKQFSGKNYWQVFESSLRVPTWFGTELFTGWNSANGTYLNPEQLLPTAGQTVIGLEVNLGRGLLIDQRRADLQKAKIYAQATLVDQRLMLLDLIIDATNAYWNWWLAYSNQLTFLEALKLAKVRHEAVVASEIRGENPAIDTLEAYLQVQNRYMNLSEAEVEVTKTSRGLSNFLWNPAGEPVEFEKPIIPADSLPLVSMPTLTDELVDSLVSAHPDLLYYQYQQAQLVIEERWRREQLKPEVAFKYQALSAAPAGDALIGAFIPASNLKWGIKFSFPLFLRKQRGYLELTRLSLRELDYQQSQKRLEIINKIAAMMVQVQQIQAQIKLATEIVANYFAMVTAENQKFEMGESSVFLVNSREQKLIDGELKLNELQSKLPKVIGEANRITGGYLLPLEDQE